MSMYSGQAYFSKEPMGFGLRGQYQFMPEPLTLPDAASGQQVHRREGDSPTHTKLGNRGNVASAGCPDGGQYRSYAYLPGSARPKVGKRYTTPRSDFRFALKPVTVARPRWIYTSFHES